MVKAAAAKDTKPKKTKEKGAPGAAAPRAAKPAAAMRETGTPFGKAIARAVEAPRPPAAIPAPPKREAAEMAPAPARTKPVALKMKALVDQVVGATGSKKKDARELVEATLLKIGEALARGDELHLPEIGKLRVVKSGGKDGAPVMTLKLKKQARKGRAGGQEGLASAAEDD
jgi:nucleoid DNA-binding protein